MPVRNLFNVTIRKNRGYRSSATLFLTAKIMKKLLVFLMTLALALSLVSCAQLSREEAVEVLSDLIPRAAALNEIIWGAGLQTDESYELLAYDVARYCEVNDASPYKTLAELRAECEAVFSESFMVIIDEICFSGNDELTPRYAESAAGRLQVNVSARSFKMRSVLYPERARVVYGIGDVLKVKIPCDFDGKPDEDYEVTLVLEDGVWKIDSPTY